MHFELEKLFRRKLIKDFFASYSESKWETLLQTILEIGVAYLESNYNVSKLSLENLQNVLTDLKSPNSQLADNLKLKSKPKENQTPEAEKGLSKNKNEFNNQNIKKPFNPINPINHQVNQNYGNSFINQNASCNSLNYYSNEYPSFPNQRVNKEEVTNNLNNAPRIFNENAVIKSEPSRENLNKRDTSPINIINRVPKAPVNSNKNVNAVVHNHITDTVKSVSDSLKAENRSKSKSKNKIYIRNKSKNDYETTRNNIFPNQKFSVNKKKKSKPKPKSKTKQAASSNKTFTPNADLNDIHPNFITEPSYSNNIYNYNNNVNDSYARGNFINNTESEINNSRNYNQNNNFGYNLNNKIQNFTNNPNRNQGKNYVEEKAGHNNYLRNEEFNQRGRQIDSTKPQKPFDTRNYTNSRSNSAGYARKPSSEWRRGDDSLEPQRVHNAYQNFNINNSVNYENNNNNNNVRTVNAYNQMNQPFNNHAYIQNIPQKPQIANPTIYPKWWDHSNSYSQDYESNPAQNEIPIQNPSQNYIAFNPNNTNSSSYINENLEKNQADNLNRAQPSSKNKYAKNPNKLNKQNQSNLEAEQHSIYLKQKEKYLEKMHQEQEVYYSDYESQKKQQILRDIQVQKSNSKSKMLEYNNEKKTEKIDVSKIESKIKDKVKNDKQNFKEKRKEADEYYKSLGFKNYEDWVNYNDNKDKAEGDTKYKKPQGPTIVKKNFLISYDKNLQPADVKENLKEIPIKKAKAMNLVSEEESKINNLRNNETHNFQNTINNNNYNNNVDFNNNYYGGNSNIQPGEGYKSEFRSREDNNYVMNYQNKSGTGDEYRGKDNAYGDYNRKDNNSYSNNYNNRAAADKMDENTFKNFNSANNNMNSEENNNEDAEREMLSSFSPSEKTKNFFQREMGQEKYFENENPKNYQNANDSQILSTNSLRMNSIEEPLLKNKAHQSSFGNDKFNS